MTSKADSKTSSHRTHVMLVALVVWGALTSLAPAQAEALVPPHPEHMEVDGFALAGVGFPELVHAEVGFLVHERLALEVRAGYPLLNPLVGVAATTFIDLVEPYVWRRPPRHVLLFSAVARINPTLRPLTTRSSGDVLAASAGAYVGYAYLSDSDLYVRLLAGALIYRDNGLAVGPNLTIGVGRVF